MSFVTRDAATGMRHGGIRWPHGTYPAPFGCRWCGTARHHHGRMWMMRFDQGHYWVRPTNAQIKARMLARRAARLAPARRPQIPSDLVVTITADAKPAIEALHGLQATLMFGFHPDLQETP